MSARRASASERVRAWRVRLGALGLAVGLGAGLGCSKKSGSSAPSPVVIGSVTLPAGVASGLPIDPRLVSSAVNPKGEAPYAGPTGTIRGRVRVSGGSAPSLERVLARIPADCQGAKSMYGRLFREGPERGLADAVVGVTGYQGYVPETSSSQLLEARDCAFSSRTVVLTFGQRLDVVSRDRRAYVPDLLGHNMRAQLVAVPGGVPVSLFPDHVGRYLLTDSMRLYITAEVIVVKFPTHAVTGLDGRYEIRGVPAGKLQVSALLPATLAEKAQSVKLEPDQTLEVDFDLPFDATRWASVLGDGGAAPASSASAPAAP